MKIKYQGQIYCEYKDHIRIHDYLSIMINNYPLILWRRYDFGLHSDLVSTHTLNILGFNIFMRTMAERIIAA